MLLGNLTPKCKKCGQRYPIIMGDELPAMVGFQLEDGKTYNICKRCLMDLGEMNEDDREKFFEEIGAKK